MVEAIFLCLIIGGLTGFKFRIKEKNKWIGIILGAFSAIIISYLLSEVLHTGLIFLPVYSFFGAWLSLFILKKLSSSNR